jgi:MFS family permease
VRRWGALVVLAIAQFVMVLDQAVMNVSISQLVHDFDTTVTTIQGVITLYAIGSAMTALAPTVGILALGWSILEGLGAALVLPALAALVAGNYEGHGRVVAYATIGGVAGAGIAVGPILGGWVTTELTWRLVFVGEVVIVGVILALLGLLSDAPNPGPKPRLDWMGTVLSAGGLGLMVLGVLQASTWGWVQPKSSPVEPFGFALTPFVVAAGAVLLWLFVGLQRRREARGLDPLVHLSLFRIPSLTSGLEVFLGQNTILMGVFFSIPLYLQLVQGLDALDTGIRMLPVSVAMFATSLAGSRMAGRRAPRTIIRAGLVVLVVSIGLLLSTIKPTLQSGPFALSMALLGVGMGLIVSQLGNIVQSSVDASGRSEAGGLQYTSQQLGSSLGVALVGAIVLTGLASVFTSHVADDTRISAEVKRQVSVQAQNGIDFVSTDEVEQAATDAGLDQATTDALVGHYSDAQLAALKAGLLAAGLIAIGAFAFTRNLPAEKPGSASKAVAAT